MNEEKRTETMSIRQQQGGADSGATISVFGREEEGTADRALPKKWSDFRFGREQVSAEQLKEQLAAFLSRMDEIVQKLPAKMGEFTLDSVELSVEVSAKGSVSLLGTGGEAGGKGGLKFTLKRRTDG